MAMGSIKVNRRSSMMTNTTKRNSDSPKANIFEKFKMGSSAFPSNRLGEEKSSDPRCDEEER
jgi:hypothetical protein